MNKKSNLKFNTLVINSNMEEESDFIPLISDEDEDVLYKVDVPEILPILPLRNTVLFPGVVIPINLGRDKSVKLIKDVYKKSKIIGAIAQKDAQVDDPEFLDIYDIGTVAQIIKILEMPDGSSSVIIQGKKRFRLKEKIASEPYLMAKISVLEDKKPAKKNKEFEAIIESLKDLSLKIINLSSNIPPEASFAVKNIESATFLINFVCSNSNIIIPEKQKLLEINDLKKRSNVLLEHLVKEVQMLELKMDIQSKVKIDMDQ